MPHICNGYKKTHSPHNFVKDIQELQIIESDYKY